MQFTDSTKAPSTRPITTPPDAVYICFRKTSDKRAEAEEPDAVENQCTLEAVIYNFEARMEREYCHAEIVFFWSAATRTRITSRQTPAKWMAWCAYRKDGVTFWARTRESYRPNGWSCYCVNLNEQQRTDLFLFALSKHNKPFNFAVVCNFFCCTRALYLFIVYALCNCGGLCARCGLHAPGEAYFCTELIVEALQCILKDTATNHTSIIHTLKPHATLPDTLQQALKGDGMFIAVPMIFAEHASLEGSDNNV